MKKKSKDRLQIIDNNKLNETHFVLSLLLPKNSPKIFAGQFVEVLVENSPNTFLRRPISIHNIDENNRTLDILIKKVGDGTKKLSQLKKNDFLDVVYPLGNGFSMAQKNEKVLLAGGGCGVAPLLYLAKTLNKNGAKCHIAIGGKNQNDIFLIEKYKEVGEVSIMTEDGSIGNKGLITSHTWFNQDIKSFSKIYCCGPEAMMKAIGKLANKNNIYCEVSLENLMACGIGACLCCTVNTDEGNLRACVEGPIFDVKKLTDWNHNPVCHG